MTLRAVTGRSLVAMLLMLSLGLGAGVPAVSAEPVLVGLYPPGALLSPAVMDTITDVDNWIASTGKRVTIAATAVTLEDAPYFLEELEGAWSRGYVPFVNFRSGAHKTTDIANGLVDAPVRAWAVQFALWAKNGQRRAFIAPLLEMNGYWNPFYVPAGYAQFKGAYQRIFQIFQEELANQGVVHHAMSRVFAPNGWPPPPSSDAFENYYPGPDLVDVVSTNGYNFGGCTNPASWDTFNTVHKPYLDRLPAMAPGKPIFISETGTVKEGGDKNQWLQELFTRVTAIPNFRAVLYLNKGEIRNTLPNCPNGTDYRLHEPGTDLWLGFKNTIGALSNYVYWAPNSPEMRQFFGDAPVPPTPTPSLVAAVLPLSRSVTVPGPPATAFAVMINAGNATATNCRPAPPASPPANFGTFAYQTTTVANALTGTPNTPANIAAGAFQNYVFSITPAGPIPLTSLALRFLCDNAADAPQTPGANNFFLIASTDPTPDTIALMATISNDGVVRIPAQNGIQVFAIGSSNVGSTGVIDVSADTGDVPLPLTLTVCETNTATGACLASPTASVSVTYTGGTNRSFAFFAQASGPIAFAPGTNRVYARLKQAGTLLGATSAAVCTMPNAGC